MEHSKANPYMLAMILFLVPWVIYGTVTSIRHSDIAKQCVESGVVVVNGLELTCKAPNVSH